MESELSRSSSSIENEIDLKELFFIFWNEKWLIFFLTSFISISSVIYSIFLPNIYESRAILTVTDPSSHLTSGLDNISNVASITGLQLPLDKKNSNYTLALKKLESLSFFENQIMPKIFLPDLMAFKSWNYKTNSPIYDENIYDSISKTWQNGRSNLSNKIPSAQKSYKVFKRNHLFLTSNRRNGFVTLGIKHRSPYIAQQWANLIVEEINSFYREKDKRKSEKSVEYLNNEISDTRLSEIKIVIAQLLQQETKKLALIESNINYVFDYVDPPVIMEQKSEPNRSSISIVGTFLGLVFSLFFVLIKYFVFKNKETLN